MMNNFSPRAQQVLALARKEADTLVHEAYLRLLQPDAPDSDAVNPRQFFFAASEAMRRILIESARRKRLERDADQEPEFGNEETFAAGVPEDEPLAMHTALERLEQTQPDLAKVVVMRYFGGMTIKEIALCLDVSEKAADRQWRAARAWLQREISDQE